MLNKSNLNGRFILYLYFYLLGNPNKYVYINGRFIVFVICCITCFVYCYKIIFCFHHQQITTGHSSNPKFIQWWPNVGPPSMTLTRHWLGYIWQLLLKVTFVWPCCILLASRWSIRREFRGNPSLYESYLLPGSPQLHVILTRRTSIITLYLLQTY